MKINLAILNYLNQCSNIKKLEPLTLKAYSIDLSQFQKHLAPCCADVIHLNKTTLINYIDTISSKYTAKSLKRKVASLKAFFNYLEFEDIIPVTPFRKIRLNIKEPKRIPKALTLFDIEKLFAYLYRNTSNNPSESVTRNIAIFEVLFATGVRISELCNICMSDINLENQTVCIKGKGNKERIAFINNPYTLAALQNYIAIRPANSSPFLFINRIGNGISAQSVRFFIEKLGRIVLDKHITPHMIRHTFATLLLEEGVDLTYIKSFLGHSSITTTQIYAASTTYKQRQILTTLHPRNRIRTPHE